MLLNVNTHRLCAVVAILLTQGLSGSNAFADEHLFNLAYTSEVLPKGGMEFQQLIASRWDKGMGSYLANDLETEIEYGITDRLQISGYLLTQNIHIKDAFPHEAVDDGLGNISEGDRLYPNRNFTGFSGLKAQLKYNVLSPYLNDGWGLSFTVEPQYKARFKVDGSKTRAYEVEAGVQVQKNFLDDQLITTFNSYITQEYRVLLEDNGTVEHEREWSNFIAATYRVAPNWYVGLETRHHMDVLKDPDTGRYKKNQYSWYVGPTVHYTTKAWWATVGYYRQIMGNPTYATPAFDGVDSNLHLDENEKNELRVRVGFDF